MLRSCRRPRMPSLAWTLLRWYTTAFRLRESCVATSGLLRPWARSKERAVGSGLGECVLEKQRRGLARRSR